MNERILSESDIREMQEYMASFQKNVKDYYEQMQDSINVFNNNAIVQSFYASGNFGKEMEEELLKIKQGIQRYYEALIDGNGLVPVTQRVMDSHLELLNRSYNGGAR